MRHVLVCALVFAACSQPAGETFDRKRLLTELTDVVIIPSYTAAVTEAQAFSSTAQSFCDAPDATRLSMVQEKWRSARSTWQRTLAFRFGPGEILGTEGKVDNWPTSTTALDGVIAGTTEITEASQRDLGTNKLGFPAAEYLLFRVDGDHAQQLAAFNDAPRRCTLLKVLAAAVVTDLRAIRDEWQNTYRTELTTAGEGSATYPTLKAAIDQVVNQQISTVESLLRPRIAKPLGLEGDGTPHPDKVDSPYSNTSTMDMIAILDGIEHAYLGTFDGQNTLSLSAYVASKDAKADGDVKNALAHARDAVNNVQGTWAETVVSRRDDGEALYDAVRAIKQVFGTEVVAALGVTLTFNDLDGD